MSPVSNVMMGARPTLPLGGSRSSTSTRRFVITVLSVLILLASPVVVSHWVQDSSRFPVTNVDVLGTMDYADRNVFKNLIHKHTEQGFYGMNIDELRDSLEQNAWIARVRISRVWPSRITIEVEEHEPAARWNDDHLIGKQLSLFKPHQLDRQSSEFDRWSEVFRDLPQVLGAAGRHEVLLDAYRSYDEQLTLFDLSLSLLEEDDRLSQTLVLSNGVTVRLGLEQHELRMQRFLDVYERIAEKTAEQTEEQPLSFDMRYSNGFALGATDDKERLL